MLKKSPPKPAKMGVLCRYCREKEAIGDEFCSAICAKKFFGVEVDTPYMKRIGRTL